MEKLLRTNNWTRARPKVSKPWKHRRTSFNTTCPHLHNRKQDVGMDWPSHNQLVGRTHQRETQQQPKTKDIPRASINHSPRSASWGDHGDYTTESHRYSTTEVYTVNAGGQTEKLKKQRLTGRVSQIMGRQRNNPQMKGKEEASEKNAKWNRGKSTITYWVQSIGYKEA